MSIWTKRLAWDIDVDANGKPPLLEHKASSRLSSQPILIQGDKLRLELYFRSLATSPLSPSTAQELPAGSAVAMAGKLATNAGLDAATVLFSATVFAAAGAGDDLCYAAELDLNTAEIAAAFVASAQTSLTVRVDVEVQNADNSDRLTYQFDITLKQQVYAGEPPATSGNPSYYTAAQVNDRYVQKHEDQAWQRWVNGRWYHYIQSTDLWYPEVATIVDGVAVLALSQEGETL